MNDPAKSEAVRSSMGDAPDPMGESAAPAARGYPLSVQHRPSVREAAGALAGVVICALALGGIAVGADALIGALP